MKQGIFWEHSTNVGRHNQSRSSGNDSLPRGFGVGIGLLLHKFRVACDCINAVKNIHGEGMGL
jgi:hypothetical protein